MSRVAWRIWGGLCVCFLVSAAVAVKADDKSDKAAPPSKHFRRVSQFVFLSDVELGKKPDREVLRELGNLRNRVFRELELPPSNTIIQVYLFENRERYAAFMKQTFPDLPNRRAIFVARPQRLGGREDLFVYTFFGPRTEEDLRHELTHALLHSVLKGVPLWLDEGLAEYFEMPTGWDGVNYQHLEKLRGRDAPKLDLARLEKVNDVEQITPAEYRESWAWVHFMLRSSPQTKRVLLDYLQELRKSVRDEPLHPRLNEVQPSLHEALQKHLEAIQPPAPPS